MNLEAFFGSLAHLSWYYLPRDHSQTTIGVLEYFLNVIEKDIRYL